MKILVVNYWGVTGEYAGPAVLADRLFSSVVDGGHTVELLYRKRARDLVAPWAASLYPVTIRRPQSRLASITWAARVSWFFILKARKYDTIHIQGAYLYSLLPLLFAPAPVLVSVLPVVQDGDLHLSAGVRRHLKRLLQASLLKRVTVVFALSEGIRLEVLDRTRRKGNVRLIGNPAADSDLTGVRRIQPLIDESSKAPILRVLFVGRLGRTKQPHQIMKAALILAERGIRTQLTFVGPFEDAAYENEFRVLQSNLPDDVSVQITGFVQNPAEYYAEEVDVFCLPSLAEGMPGALAEAFSFGIPAIVSDVGDMGGLIRRSGGGVVVAPNPTEMADALQAFLDGQRRREMGDAAWAWARENFRPAAVARSYIAALEEFGTAVQ